MSYFVFLRYKPYGSNADTNWYGGDTKTEYYISRAKAADRVLSLIEKYPDGEIRLTTSEQCYEKELMDDPRKV